MSDATSTMIVERREPSLLEKVAALASWVLAGAIFLTVGWMAMEPDDPLGSVSALARADGILMLIQAAVLAAVCGGLATVIAGRRMADVGTLAAALGLALVSLRGATAEYLLVQGAEISDSFERGLALSFVLEALGWFLVMIVTIGVSALVTRWCFGNARSEQREDRGIIPAEGSALAWPRLEIADGPGRGVALAVRHTRTDRDRPRDFATLHNNARPEQREDRGTIAAKAPAGDSDA